jgi:hypothetical protein
MKSQLFQNNIDWNHIDQLRRDFNVWSKTPQGWFDHLLEDTNENTSPHHDCRTMFGSDFVGKTFEQLTPEQQQKVVDRFNYWKRLRSFPFMPHELAEARGKRRPKA